MLSIFTTRNNQLSYSYYTLILNTYRVTPQLLISLKFCRVLMKDTDLQNQIYYMYYYESMQKKTHRKMSQITWQRAIFTGASPDIVAADMLNFCVRDENRCVHIAIATRSL